MADWIQYRQNERRNPLVSDVLFTNIGQAWAVETGSTSAFYKNILIADNFLITVGDKDYGVKAYNKSTGEIEWEHTYDFSSLDTVLAEGESIASNAIGYVPGASNPNPVFIDDGVLYIFGSFQVSASFTRLYFYCYRIDITDGTLDNTTIELASERLHTFNFLSSGILDNGIIYFGVNIVGTTSLYGKIGVYKYTLSNNTFTFMATTSSNGSPAIESTTDNLLICRSSQIDARGKTDGERDWITSGYVFSDVITYKKEDNTEYIFGFGYKSASPTVNVLSCFDTSGTLLWEHTLSSYLTLGKISAYKFENSLLGEVPIIVGAGYTFTGGFKGVVFSHPFETITEGLSEPYEWELEVDYLCGYTSPIIDANKRIFIQRFSFNESAEYIDSGVDIYAYNGGVLFSYENADEEYKGMVQNTTLATDGTSIYGLWNKDSSTEFLLFELRRLINPDDPDFVLEIEGTVPEDEAYDVDVDTDIQIIFNSTMAGSILDGNIYVYDNEGTSYAYTGSVDSDTITLNMNDPLPENQIITVAVNTLIQDDYGNVLAEEYSFRFATKEVNNTVPEGDDDIKLVEIKSPSEDFYRAIIETEFGASPLGNGLPFVELGVELVIPSEGAVIYNVVAETTEGRIIDGHNIFPDDDFIEFAVELSIPDEGAIIYNVLAEYDNRRNKSSFVEISNNNIPFKEIAVELTIPAEGAIINNVMVEYDERRIG